jgi:hypothetical protein
MDFWVGNVLLFVQATILVIIFGWFLGIERGWQMAHEGAEMRIPRIYKFIIKYVTPGLLLAIFGAFLVQNVFGWNLSITDPQFAPTGRIEDLVGAKANNVARLSIAFIIIVTAFAFFVTHLGGKTWAQRPAPADDAHDPSI